MDSKAFEAWWDKRWKPTGGIIDNAFKEIAFDAWKASLLAIPSPGPGPGTEAVRTLMQKAQAVITAWVEGKDLDDLYAHLSALQLSLHAALDAGAQAGPGEAGSHE